MNWIKENKLSILLIYINMFFILRLLRASYKIEKFNYIYLIILMIIITLAYWFYHSVLKRGMYKFLFTLFILIVLGIVYFFKASFINEFIYSRIIQNFEAINSLLAKSEITDFSQYKVILTIAISVITVVMIALTTKGLYNSIIIVNLIFTIYLWYTGYVDEIKNKLFIYVFITLMTYILNTYMKSTKKLIKKGVKVQAEEKRLIIYSVIASFIISGFITILPQDYTGKYISDVTSKFQNKFMPKKESAEEKGRKYKYDLSYSGYDSNDKKLGGPITINDSEAFKVKSDKPYYLRGIVKDYYNGFLWGKINNRYTNKTKDSQADSEKNLALAMLENKENTMIIYPSGLNSSTFFTPALTYNVEVDKGAVMFDDIPTFMSDVVISRPYTVKFNNVTQDLQNIFNSTNTISLNEPSPNNVIEPIYLEVPDNISQDTRQLVEEITKDSRTNLEKVIKIQRYLKEHYQYSIKVSPIPEGREFVDYFLFTEKKGYCTYFATAETIMCRLAGVPARYVEGFHMSDIKDNNGLYVITNANAHAWTEVLYCDALGGKVWYTVDAVPSAFEEIQKERKENELEKEQNFDNPVPIGSKTRNQLDENDLGGNTNTDKEKLPLKYRISLYLTAAIMVVIAIRIFFYIRKKRYILKSESIIPLYNYSLKRLKSINIIKPFFTGDMEFANSIEDKSLRIKMEELVKSVYKEYYGNNKENNINKKEIYIYIEKYIKSKQKSVKYYLNKFIH